ncbi:MAG TPA: magnesium-protoporphyrin IX monomethyl ester (oxidative) cyclase [Pseudomonadales bacterium]|nr:magnesium-protoporphyrin IX monomethyl ester (oxidative) cyclase [Pseudomonadales bacterium]
MNARADLDRAKPVAPGRKPNEATSKAQEDTLLSPRFYTTDFDAMNRIDVTPVRAEWDRMMAEFRSDSNVDHFKRNDLFVAEFKELEEPLRSEFIEFLVTSVTSEYSGCELYREIAKRVDNPDVQELMTLMARDEARHAGFLNQSLKDFGLAVDLGFLSREKDHTFFKPKYIFYATYLSEKIGYARYITIFRHFEKHPDKRFHPIYHWFERWCNDEYRHGEAFALMMRADPKLLTGLNKLWIRFFLLAVYSTMFVRDHARGILHDAYGIDVDEYDYKVFEITSEISKQVFPLTLDTDHPKFRAGLERLYRISVANEADRKAGGALALLRRAGRTVVGGLTFARLYCLPVKRHDLPEQVLMAPAW